MGRMVSATFPHFLPIAGVRIVFLPGGSAKLFIPLPPRAARMEIVLLLTYVVSSIQNDNIRGQKSCRLATSTLART